MMNPLFGRTASTSAKAISKPAAKGGMLGMIGQLGQVVAMLKNTDPEAAADRLAAMNPEFAKFRARYKNASLEQIAAENGIDLESVKTILESLHIV